MSWRASCTLQQVDSFLTHRLSTLCICAGEAGLDRDDISAKQHDTMSERSGRAMSDDLMLEDDVMPSGSLDF